jgi:hypothetical protein
MEQHDKEMQLIALLSGELGDFTFVECDNDDVEHICEKHDNQRILMHLNEVEFFKEGQLRTVKANYCEHCDLVFVYKPA